jgi:hypothetical protein
MSAQQAIAGGFSRLFRAAQGFRARRAHRLRRVYRALGLADAHEIEELDSALDLLTGRIARLREETRDAGGSR